MVDPRKSLEKAVSIAGSQAALAAAIGVRQSTLSYWLTRSQRGVSAEHVLRIEAVTGVSRAILRPDLFGPSVPPAGGSLFCPPDTSSPPVEPRFDGTTGEDLSFPSMVRIAPAIVHEGLVTLGGSVPNNEPEDAA